MKRLLKTDQDKEEFLTWLAFLEAGVFKKGISRLQAKSGGYCCLGVGCALFIPEDKLAIEESSRRKRIYGAFPDYQDFAPNWLKRINDHSNEKTAREWSPSYANDYRWPHPSIAKKLWDLYKDEFE